MRLNPMALALAFGVAKVAVSIFSLLVVASGMSSIAMQGRVPFMGFHFLGYGFVLYELVMAFIGGAIAGALAAVVYNKVIARSAHAS
jgi:hypothetical protein